MRPLLTAIVLILCATSVAAQPVAPGLTERVQCKEAQAMSYALYVPTNYDAKRAWPILYILDARGQALAALDSFREGAEAYGYIVASSYDSASDGEMQPNIDAVREMWNDTHARFNLDKSRAYAAGFSGTVRALVAIAYGSRKSIRGIVGAGAGFPEGKSPSSETPFIFFGTVGETDFNHDEMQRLTTALASAKVPHRLDVFPGGHQWMTPDLGARSLQWLTLLAMRDGIAARDEKLIDRSWAEDLARAEQLQSEKRLLDSLRLDQWMAADYEGLRDTSIVSARAKELESSSALRKQRQSQEERIARDEKTIARAHQVLASDIAAEKAVQQLGIRKLQETAKGGGDEALAAKRVLSTIWIHSNFYLPRQLESRGETARVLRILSIARAVRPEHGPLHYEMARHYARLGKLDDSLTSLREAVRLGWSDRDALSREEAFAPLRTRPEFEQLVTSIESP